MICTNAKPPPDYAYADDQTPAVIVCQNIPWPPVRRRLRYERRLRNPLDMGWPNSIAGPRAAHEAPWKLPGFLNGTSTQKRRQLASRR
jgi:hypothetical protein